MPRRRAGEGAAPGLEEGTSQAPTPLRTRGLDRSENAKPRERQTQGVILRAASQRNVRWAITITGAPQPAWPGRSFLDPFIFHPIFGIFGAPRPSG
jgi:hypothetical protein